MRMPMMQQQQKRGRPNEASAGEFDPWIVSNASSNDSQDSRGSNKGMKKGLLRLFGGKKGRGKKGAQKDSASEMKTNENGTSTPKNGKKSKSHKLSSWHPVGQRQPQQQQEKIVAEVATAGPSYLNLGEKHNHSTTTPSVIPCKQPSSSKLDEPTLRQEGPSPRNGKVTTKVYSFDRSTDYEDERGATYIRTKQGSSDSSTVSECTNPTFLSKKGDKQENIDFRKSKTNIYGVSVDANTTPQDINTTSSALDPFDVNSPIFSGGDPFQKLNTKDPSDRFIPGGRSSSDEEDEENLVFPFENSPTRNKTLVANDETADIPEPALYCLDMDCDPSTDGDIQDENMQEEKKEESSGNTPLHHQASPMGKSLKSVSTQSVRVAETIIPAESSSVAISYTSSRSEVFSSSPRKYVSPNYLRKSSISDKTLTDSTSNGRRPVYTKPGTLPSKPLSVTQALQQLKKKEEEAKIKVESQTSNEKEDVRMIVEAIEAKQQMAETRSSFSVRHKSTHLRKRMKERPATGFDATKLSNLPTSQSHNVKQNGRSIIRRSLRKNQKTKASEFKKPPASSFMSYDSKAISDPMQLAGLRLMSTAVIPIQTAVRRYLALREAMVRMCSIVAIQSVMRRILASRAFAKKRALAVTIQAVYRGGRTRDVILLEQCCAIEIQRFVRGYLATMQVYDDIYKINLIQSFVRRNIAIDLATDRMVFIIKVQSIVRGFLLRRRIRRCNEAATKIQRMWKSFYCRLSYQLNVLDITIVQSVCRKMIARRRFKKLLSTKENQAATKIQTQWRSYDCMMNYLYFIADVVIVQSAARRWTARKQVLLLKRKHATKQAIALQSTVRVLLAKRELVRHKRARVIQAVWRGHVLHRCYKEYRAARDIQRIWRGFVIHLCFAGYMAARNIQKVARGFACYRSYKQLLAARTIQTRWRSFVCSRSFKQRQMMDNRQRKMVSASLTLQKVWRGFVWRRGYVEFIASRSIQNKWRCFVSKQCLRKHKAARSIQAGWRGFICYADYMFTVADIVKAQALARRLLARREAAIFRELRDTRCALAIQKAWKIHFLKRYLSAVTIQRYCRGFMAKTEFLVAKCQHRSATLIQAHWRGFCDFSDFIISADAIIRIQALFRGYVARCAAERKILAVLLIQSTVRDLFSRSEANCRNCIFLAHTTSELVAVASTKSATSIQKVFRGYQGRHLYKGKREKDRAASLIQSLWRCHVVRDFYVQYIAVRKIQSLWRCHVERDFYVQYIAVRKIQTIWRGFLLRDSYKVYIGVRRIQATWRSHVARKPYKEHKKFKAAVSIQAIWRGHMIRLPFLEYVSARRIQALWRGYLMKVTYDEYVSARRIQALWRCSSTRKSYQQQCSAAGRLQTAWRRYFVMQFYQEFLSARRIQSLWRSYSVKMCYDEYIAARCIQSKWRGYRCKLLLHSYREHAASVLIQTVIRTKLARVSFLAKREVLMSDTISAAVVAQRTWRGCKARENGPKFTRWIALYKKNYAAAVELQRIWRGVYTKQNYWHTLGSAIQVQAILRGWKTRGMLRQKQAAAINLQCLYRACRARQEAKQRRFIIMLVNSAQEKKVVPEKKIEPKYHEWEHIVKRQQDVDRAARKIQRFFLMVKKEIDHEIQMKVKKLEEKKRKRKAKKRQKKKNDVFDDDMLENAWHKTVDQVKAASFDHNIVFREDKGFSTRLNSRPPSGDYSTQRKQSEGKIRDASDRSTLRRCVSSEMKRNPQSSTPMPLRQFLDAGGLKAPKRALRDDQSASSRLSKTSGHFRLPPSRLTSLTPIEIDDDLNLEEAWIDAEIHDARERRMRSSRVRSSSRR